MLDGDQVRRGDGVKFVFDFGLGWVQPAGATSSQTLSSFLALTTTFTARPRILSPFGSLAVPGFHMGSSVTTQSQRGHEMVTDPKGL